MKNEYKVDLARSPDGGSTGQERKPRQKDQTARTVCPNRPSGFLIFGHVSLHVSWTDWRCLGRFLMRLKLRAVTILVANSFQNISFLSLKFLTIHQVFLSSSPNNSYLGVLDQDSVVQLVVDGVESYNLCGAEIRFRDSAQIFI